LPAISFPKYLCSLAEIMSMWIGISIFGEGKRIIDLFSAIIRSRIKQETKAGYYKRILKYIHLLFLALCLSLSLLLTYNTFLQYFNYEYIVHVSSDVQLIFPSIMIEHRTFPLLTFENLFKVTNLEERKRKIEEYFSVSFSVSCQLKQNNQTIISSDHYFSQHNEYYKWDNWNFNKLIIMENGGREKVELMRVKNRTIKRDFKMNIEGKTNININLRLPKLNEKMFSLLKDERHFKISFIQGAIGEQYDINVPPNRHTYVSFKLRSIQLLPSPYSTDCFNYPTEFQSSDQDCYQKCLTRLENERDQCIEIRRGYFTMNDFISKTIDLVDEPCNDKKAASTQSMEIGSDCKLKCKPNCRFNSFDLFTHFDGYKNSLLNDSRVILFPSEKPFIKYIYTPKMDINQLVYDLGGIIALWFGLSAYSIIMKSREIIHSRINQAKIIINNKMEESNFKILQKAKKRKLTSRCKMVVNVRKIAKVRHSI